ncbi:helix-turn-helix domain-containing protein [Mycobacteroides abscessus]|uniref:helix-turn-helix domain-containing protein n=1 Tax=Mycobacteroides abscessus TaxID=36809 RepID=UPI0005DBD79F|nr:helix-turn-helix domain-containing protein [Mycobacteroides abscessus]CPW71980.1 DNA binding domain%2C excisionase family [Mycobacteroides abscessus]SKF62151.1 DNA binding domain, excisionase family [Mycobacteroides abscessus subsp. bolletii]SKH91307.1 DNA binding domain, excisionase family [Mycobacteroides abscessus subsp. bolletii]
MAIDLEGVPPQWRERIASLPPEQQEFMLRGMAAVFKAPAEPKLPEPPTIDDRDLLRQTLYPRRDLFDEPLSPREQTEFDALAATRGDQTAAPAVYNQPVTMLTVSETAQALGISTTGVRRLIRSRRLRAFRMFKTVRVRSDLVWAFVHRPDLSPGPIGDGPAYRPNRGKADPFRGVPLAQIAAQLRVHPQTVRRWDRYYQANEIKLWAHGGQGKDVAVMSETLARHHIPFDQSQLRFVSRVNMRGASADVKRTIAAAMRRLDRAPVRPDQVRRGQPLIDAATGRRLYTYPEVAAFLKLTPSGARKAIAAAGIPVQILGGVARVRYDDMIHLMISRHNKALRKNTPWMPAVKPDAPQLVPIAQAAARMGVTVRTVRRWIAAKKIVGVIRDEALWIRAADLETHGEVDELSARGTRKRAAATEAAVGGATLTNGHIASFIHWLRYSAPEVDLHDALHTRTSAAELAGCRPVVIENLVREGLIPAQRNGRDLRIRTVDLYAAGVFSAKVARMCPNLKAKGARERHRVVGEYVSFEQAAARLKRPVSEIRRLVADKTLLTVRFGQVHRMHVSEIEGPGLARFKRVAQPYPPLKYHRSFSQMTVNEAANELGLSERTVLRWVRSGALLGAYASRKKWWWNSYGVPVKIDVPVNRNGALLSARTVIAARRLRQVRGLLPRDLIEVTRGQLSAGNYPELKPWQEFMLVDEQDVA